MGPPSGRTFDVDPSPVGSDDPVHDGQAKPRSLAGHFGREERLEDPVADRLGNPCSGIGDLEPRCVLVTAGNDGQRPSLGHRIDRVHREIHDDLFDLSAIRADPERDVRRLDAQTDVCAHDAMQELHEVTQNLVEVQSCPAC